MTVVQAVVAKRYVLTRPIGSGGMGRVWLARDEVLDRDVAVKEVMLPFGLADSEREELVVRTLREARTAARLNHPNVVRIYDVVRNDDKPWIVMEYVRSRSLLQVIKDEGSLPVHRVAVIGLAVLRALAASHRAGVVHRDVKPSNVLIADDGRVVLSDFGLATFEESDNSVTRPGLILGSPHYIAPERARDGVSTAKSDLWSLGATLYTALEGRAPFARATTLATLTALATERPDPSRRAGALKPVLDGLLRKNPRARLGVAEAERLLERIVAGEPTTWIRRVPRQRGEAAAELPTAPVPAPARTFHGPGEPATGARPRRWRWAAVTSMVGALAAVSAVVLPAGDHVSTRATLEGRAVAARTGTAAPPAEAALRPAPVPTQTEAPLPAGWVWYRHPAGFRVAVPAGWPLVPEGDEAYFCDPAGARMLVVAPWDTANGDYLAAFKRDEAEEDFAAYRPLRMETVAPGSAEWEYVYNEPNRGRLHGLNHTFVVRGQGYVIAWRTPPAEWNANLVNFALVRDSFRAPSPARPTY